MTMFKNATIYVLPLDFDLPPVDELDDAIIKHTLREPGPLELETRGFVDAAGSVISGNTRLTMGTATRLVPSSVIRTELDKWCDEHEAQNGRKPGKRRRAEMRDTVLGSLLPRAFIKQGRTAAYYDRELRMLIVDSSSAKAGEQLCALLRDALGSFPARPLECERSLPLHMTQWLISGDALPRLASEDKADYEHFSLGDECALEDPDDHTSRIKASRHELNADEIREHARVGKQVTQLSLIFDDRISFVLDAKLRLRKLRFLDVVREKLDPQEDEATARDAEFALMSLELRRLIARLGDVLGWVR